MNYTSDLKICGIPFISIVLENKSSPSKPAVGIIAVGQYAIGVVCVSQFGIGILSISQFGIGAFGVFQFGIAIASVSQFGINLFGGIGQRILNIL